MTKGKHLYLQDLPSQDAIQIANNISDLGQIYNREDMDSDNPVSVTKTVR
jgi:hypothetical protein